MTYPAAQSIQGSFPGMSDMEAQFVEVMLWYEGFKDAERMKLLPYETDDLNIIAQKMQDARDAKDFKTSDHLRDVLRQAGFVVKNRPE